MKYFYAKLSKTRLYKYIVINTTPRWFIIFVDLIIVGLSFFLVLLADLFRSHAAFPPIRESLYKFVIVTLVFLLMNLVTKCYQCIIRLSVMEDLYRIFLMVLYSTCTLFALNFIVETQSSTLLFSYWNIAFIGSVTFTLLLISRLSIKYLFLKLGTATSARKRVIVLGAALNSIVIATAMRNETHGKFEPVALLSITNAKHKSQINNIPIEDFDENLIGEIFEKYQTSTVVFLSTQIERLRNGLADIFLKNGITLLRLNQVEEFDMNENGNNSQISSHINNIQIEDLLGRETIKHDNALVKSNIHNQCVMITGGAGSIGSEIVRQVAAFGASHIVLIDQAETPMHNMQLEMEEKFPNTKITLFIADIQNYERLEMAFDSYKPRFVFHAAAYKHVPMMEHNPTEAILTNIGGTKNVADLALKYNAYKFVMISTDKAVNPTNIMGATKRIAEIYVQSLFFDTIMNSDTPNTTQFITTRFGNVLGSNGSVIPRFRTQIEHGGPVTVTHKDIIRYFMTIPEACSLVLEAGCMGNGGEIYIFDMGSPVKIYDLATRMITLAGLRVDKDIKIIETGLRPGEKLYEELLNDKEKTQATINNKIMTAKVQRYDYGSVCKYYKEMINLAQKGQIHDLVKEMKEFIPEYKSMNSEFESIDEEISKVEMAKKEQQVI